MVFVRRRAGNAPALNALVDGDCYRDARATPTPLRIGGWPVRSAGCRNANTTETALRWRYRPYRQDRQPASHEPLALLPAPPPTSPRGLVEEVHEPPGGPCGMRRSRSCMSSSRINRLARGSGASDGRRVPRLKSQQPESAPTTPIAKARSNADWSTAHSHDEALGDRVWSSRTPNSISEMNSRCRYNPTTFRMRFSSTCAAGQEAKIESRCRNAPACHEATAE